LLEQTAAPVTACPPAIGCDQRTIRTNNTHACLSIGWPKLSTAFLVFWIYIDATNYTGILGHDHHDAMLASMPSTTNASWPAEDSGII
jgi:hypothetical protein